MQAGVELGLGSAHLCLSTRNAEGVLMLCLQFVLSYCPVLLKFLISLNFNSRPYS